MSDINPYYQWFGIDSSIAQPSPRQLLGLSESATTAEIDKAYTQRQTILNAFRDGPHHEIAAKLQTEIDDARQKVKLELSINSPSSRPDESDQPALPLASSIDERKPSSTTKSRRQKNRKDKNIGLQIAMFFVPTGILLVILIFFPSTMTGIVNGIRSIVYGPKPERSDDRDAQNSETIEPKRINKKRQSNTSGRIKSKPADSKVDLKSSQNGRGPETKQPNPNRNAIDLDPKSKAAGNTTKSGKKSRPSREVVSRYLSEFLKLPQAYPAEFFGLADAETNTPKQYAIFEFGMDLAMIRSNSDELIYGFELWNRHFDMDWEKEVLGRLLTAKFENPGEQIGLANRIPSLMKRCRAELCIESGKKLCDKALAFFPESPSEPGYLSRQIKIFQQSEEYDGAGESPDKSIFDSLFFETMTPNAETPAMAKTYFQLWSDSAELVETRGTRSIDRYDELIKKLQAEAKSLSTKLKSGATVLLLEESLAEISSRMKTEIRRLGVDWSERANSRFALKDEEIYSLDLRESVKKVAMVEQTHSVVFDEPIRKVGFSGKASRLFVITNKQLTVVDPNSRRRKRHDLAIKDTRDLLSHPSSYLTVNFEGRTVKWRDISTNETLTAKLELASTSLRTPTDGNRPERLRQIGILNPRGDILVQNGQHLIQIPFPRNGTANQLQEKFESGISQPIGIVTNAKNMVAVVGKDEVVILDNKKESRRVKHNSAVRDFIFSKDKSTFYMATRTRLVKLGGLAPIQIDVPRIVKIEEVDSDLLLVLRQVSESTYSLQLLKIVGNRTEIIQETLSRSAQFTLSHDRKFVAVAENNKVRILAIQRP